MGSRQFPEATARSAPAPLWRPSVQLADRCNQQEIEGLHDAVIAGHDERALGPWRDVKEFRVEHANFSAVRDVQHERLEGLPLMRLAKLVDGRWTSFD